MFKDIILAVTPSEVCQCAADAGFAFAKKHESNLAMIHVCGLPSHGWGSIEHMMPSGEVDKIKAGVEKHYAKHLAEHENCQVTVVPGIPHSEILRLARKKNADLIVMGCCTKDDLHRRAKMWGVAGSNIERVTQKARCPVMIVAREVPEERMQFDSIVVATDFSFQAECAIGYGGQLARQYKAALHIFTVLDIPQGHDAPSQEEIEEGIAAAKARMEKEFGPRLEGIREVSYECWEGVPSMEILKYARMQKADLILMAHHSKEKDPEEAYLGSTVAQVALNASCPTISINRHFDLRCGLFYDQSGAVTSEEPAKETAS
ncbi:universal stress protein [Desulfovibrio ferrophilus]|uniref:UspA domain-containing protein n=1 Tax=Desulfovibrio ferrophilus TaxID=241368 RepID=A0A2Z6B126_9BACT|nr:universal stress protein [Desulfovibrio ferrophilus]BBD09219.1 UspA domain-containing protein [Desulfovibrio ferrophilus]